MIEQALNEPGARDVTASYRDGGERLVNWEDCAYLNPTLIRCDADHPLATREYLFPFAAVIEAPQAELLNLLGPSLSVCAITRDPKLIQALVNSPHIDRLNIGPMPTNQISWDQPHEGNLFDHLYGRRAFQHAIAV
jgi:acyl-CoA reductase-like NAD-dependent aldehyde dehydrogenase